MSWSIPVYTSCSLSGLSVTVASGCVSYISSNFAGGAWNYEPQRKIIDLDDTDFIFKLKDGSQVTIPAKEYYDLIAYNGISPQDCENEKDLKEKIMAIRL